VELSPLKPRGLETLTSWLQIGRGTVGKDPHRPPQQGCRLGALLGDQDGQPVQQQIGRAGRACRCGCVCSRAVAEQRA